MSHPDLIDAIDLLLPQTQCTKCGYHGCRPYAEAIAAGDAINKCPPGGDEGIAKLAALLNRPPLPLDTSHGQHQPLITAAFIREAECIGCTKCIQACPVDAILGAAKRMHTIITDHCTGCDLCVAPCPVDCIDMLPLAVQPDDHAQHIKANLSRQRFEKRKRRLAKIQADKQHTKKIATSHTPDPPAAISEALAQIRQQAEQQPRQQQQAKLERVLASAQERYQRALQKIAVAERKTPDMLPQLRARLEDMRFKVEEAEQKLAALQQTDADNSHNAQQLAAQQAAEAALNKMLAARSRLSDNQRLQNALASIDRQIAGLFDDLDSVEDEEKPLIQADLDRLQSKRAVVAQELEALEATRRADGS